MTDGIYQVRGLDLCRTSTFFEGDSGIIVIDPLISTETAAAALGLYRKHRGDRPVVGVILHPQSRRSLRRGLRGTRSGRASESSCPRMR